MEFPEGLKLEIERQSETEFNNPTTNFGERLRDLIMDETGQELPEDEVFKLNWWGDVWLEPQFTWRDFVLWVWRIIVAWWKSLFE